MLLVIVVFGQKTSISKKRTLDKKKLELKHTTLGIGVGITRSVIFLSRNVREFNDATGFNVGLVYGGNKLVRLAIELHQYSPVNIEPTWYNINAKTYEANIQLLARFKNGNSIIYPITGISVNHFKGYFTGKEDFQNLADKYPVNSEVSSFWIGGNFGLGYEHQIGPLKAVLQYKMRVGVQDVVGKVNIMDVCYSLGLRYDFKALTPKAVYRVITRNYKARYDVN
ncbi:MAG: hypothetical protein KBG47_10830 [Bacteroidia bacterium]|nr:hypothetical protein [Bacteroidia bacterium]